MTSDTQGLIDEFGVYLVAERHFSPKTAKCYAADLQQLGTYLTAGPTSATQAAMKAAPTSASWGEWRVEFLAVDTPKVQQFLGFLSAQIYSKATIARKIAALRSFYNFCMRQMYVMSSPMASIKTPKRERTAPKVLERAAIVRLMATPDVTTLLGARDRAMLEVIYSSGLTISQLVNLDLADVHDNRQNPSVILRCAGKRERPVPLGLVALSEIKRYLDLRRAANGALTSTNCQALFVNKDGDRLSMRSLRRKLEKYLAKAELDPDISPQTLRATFASHMLARGADLRLVQELLGHRSISSTNRYSPNAQAVGI